MVSVGAISAESVVALASTRSGQVKNSRAAMAETAIQVAREEMVAAKSEEKSPIQEDIVEELTIDGFLFR